MSLEISFHGAAGTVTGSCTLIRHRGGTLLVDCGLFQGSKTVRELNYGPFPFDPKEPAALLLTHAHIDHSGLIPKLARQGFKGPVFATSGTADLLACVLPDSGYVQESDVERLNRRNRRRGHAPVEPIYTRADAEACLGQIRPVEYGEWIAVMTGVRARFWDAGHILGSASIEIEIADGDDDGDQKGRGGAKSGAKSGGKRGGRKAGGEPLRLLFSGDLGPGGKPFHPDPSAAKGVDFLFVESTYGDRERAELSATARRAAFGAEVTEALAAGGNLLIPVFAVERTQELLYDLDRLFDAGTLPKLDVFLDSPLAIKATEVFRHHLRDINVHGTPHPFHRPNLHFSLGTEESMAINRVHGGAIIMAGSGMCDAGRIRHHLKNNLWRPEATVLLVGYQAPGTLGRLLEDGAKRVRIHGDELEVKARIRKLDLYSGHADRNGLADWASARQPVRFGTFLLHGEDPARQGLRRLLVKAGFADDALYLPRLDAVATLERSGQVAMRVAAPRLADLPRMDWHNTYADTLLSLGSTLRGLPDDQAREALLGKIRRAIAKGA